MSTFSYIQSYRFVSVAKKLIQRIMNNVSSFIVSMYEKLDEFNIGLAQMISQLAYRLKLD